MDMVRSVDYKLQTKSAYLCFVYAVMLKFCLLTALVLVIVSPTEDIPFSTLA